jgi:hypothetical protein
MSSVMRFDEWQDSNGVPVASGAGGKFVAPGNVLQVVQTPKTDTLTLTSMTSGEIRTITGLSATITPFFASSKILVLGDINSNFGDGEGTAFILKRNGTAIGLGDASQSRTSVTSGGPGSDTRQIHNDSFKVLDSPSTTSALTYTVDVLNGSGVTATFALNYVPTQDTNVARTRRGASRITLIEVAG